MNIKNLLIIIVLTTLGCAEETVQPIINCFETPSRNLNAIPCGDDSTMNACEVIKLNELSLTQQSKEWLPSLCLDNGAILSFTNQFGVIKEMEVFFNSHIISRSSFNTFEKCDEHSEATKYFCMDAERGSTILKSVNDTLELTITLTTRPNVRVSDGNEMADFLSISRKKSQTSFSYAVDFTAVVDERNYTDLNFLIQEFYETITLNGKVFEDVISIDTSSVTNFVRYKYYYSKKEGLIGFLDNFGDLWIIQN